MKLDGGKKERKKITQFKFSWGCVSWRLMKSKCSSLIQKCESDGGLIAHLDSSQQSKRKIIADAFCQQTNKQQTDQASKLRVSKRLHPFSQAIISASVTTKQQLPSDQTSRESLLPLPAVCNQQSVRNIPWSTGNDYNMSWAWWFICMLGLGWCFYRVNIQLWLLKSFYFSIFSPIIWVIHKFSIIAVTL